MKHCILGLLITLVTTLPFIHAAAVSQSRWYLLDREDQRTVYADTTTITPTGGHRYLVWIREIYASPQRDSQKRIYDSELSRIEFDCAARSDRTFDWTLYLNREPVFSYDPEPTDWISWTPDTYGEFLGETVCGMIADGIGGRG